MPDRLIFGLVPWYSVLILCGMLSALYLAQKEEKRYGLPPDTVIDLCLWMIPIGILGARCYYVVFNWAAFAQAPMQILMIWQGGLAIYGALIAGGVTLLIFARLRRLKVATLLDTVAIGLPLAQTIGRWGNFFNGEAYGLEVLNPSLQFFPFAVRIAQADGLHWQLATFFYESLWNCAIFLVLWRTRRRMKRPGDVFAWYVLLYASGRAWIEGLRLDSLMTAGHALRISQVLSCVMMLAVLVYFLITRAKDKAKLRWLFAGWLIVAAVVYALLPNLPVLLRLLCALQFAVLAVASALHFPNPAKLMPALLLAALMPLLTVTVQVDQPDSLVWLMLWQSACGMTAAWLLDGRKEETDA